MVEELLAQVVEELSLSNTRPRRAYRKPREVPRPKHIADARTHAQAAVEGQRRQQVPGAAAVNPFTAAMARLVASGPPTRNGRG